MGEVGTEDPAARLSFLIWHAQRAVNARLEEVLRPLGLTASQYGSLSNLVHVGELSGADLARAAGLTPQSIAVGLGHLMAKGWIERRPHPVHGRVSLQAITPAGRDVWREADRRVTAIEKEIVRVIPGRQEDWRDGLVAMISALGATPPEAAQALWPSISSPASARSQRRGFTKEPVRESSARPGGSE
jgi:DNA-binding MarR family transcriptional regulator